MSDSNKERRKWYETYDGREDIDELYQKWCDNENKPKLAIYLRTSKSNQNETNVRQQAMKLQNMFKHWIDEGLLLDKNGEEIYCEVLLEADIDFSGSTVNENFKTLLSQLTFHDEIFIFDVSRVTRMEPESDEFIKLKTKMFADYRTVHIYDSGKTKIINEKEFIESARESYFWYLTQNDLSKKGNEIKRSKANKRRDTLLFYLIGDGFKNKDLAKKFGVSERTIYLDKKILKDEGSYTYTPQPNGRKLKFRTTLFD